MAWLALAACLTLMEPPNPASPTNLVAGETYYVIAHPGAALPIWLACGIFAGVYALLLVGRVRVRLSLGWTHLALEAAGYLLCFSPMRLTPWMDLPRRSQDVPAAFEFWNQVTTVGYFLAAAGLVVFAVVVVDWGFRRVRLTGSARRRKA